jgi:hypothetical protein
MSAQGKLAENIMLSQQRLVKSTKHSIVGQLSKVVSNPNLTQTYENMEVVHVPNSQVSPSRQHASVFQQNEQTIHQ